MNAAEPLIIAAKELREMLRDRRAFFFAFILPLLLYPLAFAGAGKLETLRRADVAERPSRVALAGGTAALVVWLRADPDIAIEPTGPDLGALDRDEIDAIVLAPSDGDGREGGGDVRILFRGLNRAAGTARARLEASLDKFRRSLVEDRFRERGSRVDPGRFAESSARDVATPAAKAGMHVGGILPILLVALLLTGGAFVALDLVAGEKERGTLETLYTQPVEARSVMAGKFLTILAVSLAAVVINVAGMAASAALGLGAGPGTEAFRLPGLSAIAACLVLQIPLAVLTSAILLAVSASARTFREAQMLLLPVTLVAILPAVLAALPDIQLTQLVAVLPVAGTALAIREALAGEVRWGYLAVVLASTAFYAAIALRWAARLLAREDLRLGLENEPLLEARTARARSRRGLFFGIAMILFLSYAGSAAQQPDGPLGIWGGLAATLWVFVLLPSLAYAGLFRVPIKEALALRAPRLRDIGAAALLVPLAAVLIILYMDFQNTVLPFPEGLRGELEKIFGGGDLHPAVALFLLAVSPGICEEVLWRGVVQGEMEPEDRPLKTAVLIGLLFGIFHLDLYRLAPTAFLGALLAHVRFTTGSIVPCMLFHAFYNGTMVLAGGRMAAMLSQGAERIPFFQPIVLLAAGGLMAMVARGMWARRRLRLPTRPPILG